MTARRVDDNQREIVAYLRKAGASVLILSDVGKGCPDICVGISSSSENGSLPRKVNYLVEIKNGKKVPSAQKLTPMEQHFFDTWKGQVMILNSVEQAEIFIKTVLYAQNL